MHTEKCDQWVQRDSKVMARSGKMAYYPFVVAKGSGSTVEDVDGNTFLDFLSSAACLNLGHSHPRIVQAILEQTAAFTHYTTAYFYNTKAIEFAEKLVNVLPGAYEKKVALGLTGSDANDGAIKFAKGFTGRNKIICFKGAYHGSTLGSMSISHISLNMRKGLGTLLPDVYSFDFPNVYRNGPDDGERCIRQIEEAFASYLPAEDVAAVITEPVQGDAGILIPPRKFMHDLHALCRKYGIVFVSEEVQQAFFRIGEWFGIEMFDIEPDLVVLAKPVGGGMPLSVVAGRAEIMDSIGPPAHTFTFSGNPVSCAAGLAGLEVMSEPGFRESIFTKGALLYGLLEKLWEKYPLIGDVRGRGLSYGVELVEDRTTKVPNTRAAAKISYRAWEKGLILITLAGNVLRVQPPLVVTEEEIHRAVTIMDECIHDYLRGDIPDSVLDIVKGW